jgi:GNAT superfamily N-acetyltransferase
VNAPPVLRAGRDSDASGFIALVDTCWAEYPGCVMDLDGEVPELRALATYYAQQNGALWAAEQDGRVVGMVATKPLADGTWELCKMYAYANQRGTGLAQSLVAAAEAHARAHGATEMRLWSDTRFDRAHRFYEKSSYLRAGPIRALNDLSNSLEFEYAKPLTGTHIQRLNAAAAVSAVPRLAAILKDCVDAGGNLSFRAPLPKEKAAAYMRRVASQAARGERILFSAWSDGILAGSVTLDLALPDNQRHRAEIKKLMVAPQARRRGLASALLRQAETAASDAGRGILTLATHVGGEAEQLYAAEGWQRGGSMPDYTRTADGTPEAVVFFWKAIK